MKYIYIHGFNSGSHSRSGHELSRLVNASVFCPEYDYSGPFEQCLRELESQIEKFAGEDLCVMGTSLGGFYAAQLRLPGIRRVIAWNPVIYPAAQLEQFLGLNTRFSDGGVWMFEKATLLSYAAAPDPRDWRNFCWQSLKEREDRPPARTIFLSQHDDVLQRDLGAAFWKGHADLHFIYAAHRIENYDHALPFLAE